MPLSAEGRAILKERVSRRAKAKAVPFPEQQAAVDSDSSMVALLCSRRAGKTRAFLLKWLKVAEEKPGYLTPYVALTRQSAKNILWPEIKRMNRAMNLGLQFNESELRTFHRNGSELYALGANAREEIDKLRGIPVPLFGVDEAQAFRDTVMKELLDDVIGPGLADLEGDQWILGTPGLTPAGYFHRATTGAIPGYDVHQWTYLDNPFLPLSLPGHKLLTQMEKRARRYNFVEKWLADRGYDHDHPTYKREWLGEWWRDESGSVYKYDDERNGIDEMPADYEARKDEWIHVIWHDYGFVDSTAFGVDAFRGYGKDQTVYGVECHKRTGLTPTQAADISKRLQDKYEANILVGDAGGLGKGYIEEANLRHQLGIVAAEKTEKRAYIEHFNGAIVGGKYKVVRETNGDWIDEVEKLQWDTKYPKDDPRWHTVEDPRFENHCADGRVYGWRACQAYTNLSPEDPKANRDREWVDDDGDGEERPWWDE